MHIRATRLFSRSICDETLPIDEVILSKEDTINIGNYSLAIVQSEHSNLLNSGVLPIPFSDKCCLIHMMYGLPCHHLLLDRILAQKPEESVCLLLSIEDFPDRWRRSEIANPVQPGQTKFKFFHNHIK